LKYIKIGRVLEVPNIFLLKCYRRYANAKSTKEFLLTIANVLENTIIEEVTTSPYFFFNVE